MEPIGEITNIDVKINDRLGLSINDHSGVVEINVRTVEHRPMACGCYTTTDETYAVTTIDEDVLCGLIDGFAKLKEGHYEDSLVEELSWRLEHGRFLED